MTVIMTNAYFSDCHIILKNHNFIILCAKMKVVTLKRDSTQQALSLTYCSEDDYEMLFSKFLSCIHGCIKQYSPTISNISKPTFTNTYCVVALRRR
jgi:hypothetical protein